MALAFGPDKARLPPSSRSRFAEARPLQCSNLLQSSTRSTLGLVIHAAGSNFEWPRFSKGRLSLSLSHHKVILLSLIPVKPTSQTLNKARWSVLHRWPPTRVGERKSSERVTLPPKVPGTGSLTYVHTHTAYPVRCGLHPARLSSISPQGLRLLVDTAATA